MFIVQRSAWKEYYSYTWFKDHQETSQTKNISIASGISLRFFRSKGYTDSPLGLYHRNLSIQLSQDKPKQTAHLSLDIKFLKWTIIKTTTFSVSPQKVQSGKIINFILYLYVLKVFILFEQLKIHPRVFNQTNSN